jgi:preprotein translocase subunit SecY
VKILHFLQDWVLDFLVFTSLYGIVFLQEGVRIIPLISSKQLNQSSLQDSTTNNYIPYVLIKQE